MKMRYGGGWSEIYETIGYFTLDIWEV